MSNKYLDRLMEASEEFSKIDKEYQEVKKKLNEAEEKFLKAQEDWDNFIEDSVTVDKFAKATRGDT